MSPSFPAQIVFTEIESVDSPRRWRGRLLRPAACIDVETRRPVTWTPLFDIEENAQTGRCTITIQGGPSAGGRRYAAHPDVTTAQLAGIRWAARRFRIPLGASVVRTDSLTTVHS